MSPNGELVQVTSADGRSEIALRCPACGHWGNIDDDQLHGRVSVDHSVCWCKCTFHETRNWFKTGLWLGPKGG